MDIRTIFRGFSVEPRATKAQKRNLKKDPAAGGRTRGKREDRNAGPGGGNKVKGNVQAGAADNGEAGAHVASENGGGKRPRTEVPVEDSGDVQFNMLQLSGGAGGSGKGKGAANAPGSKMTKLKTLLQRAEEKEQRLQELKKTNADKAAAEIWKDTLKEATGEKVIGVTTPARLALLLVGFVPWHGRAMGTRVQRVTPCTVPCGRRCWTTRAA